MGFEKKGSVVIPILGGIAAQAVILRLVGVGETRVLDVRGDADDGVERVMVAWAGDGEVHALADGLMVGSGKSFLASRELRMRKWSFEACSSSVNPWPRRMGMFRARK